MSDIPHELAAALTGRYELQMQIGAGGMATVYLAHDVKHGRSVAIKVLKPEIASSMGGSRFLREIEIAARLAHPHIVPLHDSGEAAGRLFYVMPFVDGESLRDRLSRQGPLEIDEAVAITEQVATAIDYAHAQGVVHRDIKPENILLVGDRAMVADFGLGRAVQAARTAPLTDTGIAVGTPAYMSPEQVEGDPALDGRTDVYSLACVLYEMLSGRPPYLADTVRGMLTKVLTEPVPSVRQSRTDVPRTVDDALRRAMSKEAEDRFATARDFLSTLGLGTSGARRPQLPLSRAGRRRLIWGVFGAVVITVGALLAANAWWGTDAAAPATVSRIAVLPFAFRGSDVSYLGEGMVDLLSTKLDGAGRWHSIDPRAVFAMFPDTKAAAPNPAEAREVAERLGARLFVLGSVVETGSAITIDASLYDRSVTDGPVAQASAEGSSGDVLSLVDEVASQLLVGDGTAASGARLTRLAAVTTGSLGALKAYLRGTRAMRAGDFAEAGDALREAVTEDTAFALAWYQLSVAADWLLRADIAAEAADQAVRFAHRLSERDRRLLEALRTVRQGRAREAEQQYRAIIGTYPDDVAAWFQLAELQFHFGPRLGTPLSASRDTWLRVQALDPGDPTAFPHLARIAASVGDTAALDSIARLVAGIEESNRVPLEVRMLQAFSGTSDRERDAVMTAVRLEAEVNIAEVGWSASTFLGDVDAAAELIAVLAEPDRSIEARAVGNVWLAHLAVASGKIDEAHARLVAAAQFDTVLSVEYRVLFAALPFLTSTADVATLRSRLQALDPDQVPQPVARSVWVAVHDGLHALLQSYLLGLLSSDDPAAVAEYADRLERFDVSRSAGSLPEDMAIGVRANALYQRNQFADANALYDGLLLHSWHQLNVASAFFSAGRQRFLRARTAQLVEQYDEALFWYRTFENTGVFDLPYVAPAHYFSAQIHEARGERAEARAHYARFAELWSNADPTLQPMVNDARRHIAQLGDDPAAPER